MSMHKYMLALRDSPCDVEVDCCAGVTFYCESLWQMASKNLRSRYSIYEMTPQDFASKCEDRKNLLQGSYNSLEYARRVVHTLIQGFEILPSDRSPSDQVFIDAALQHGSLVSCMLGNRPCLGDIEFFMSITQILKVPKVKRPTPRTMLREYRKGNARPLISFLYKFWEASLEEMMYVSEEDDIESMFIYRKNSMEPGLNYAIINTNFYLASSLISYFMTGEGSA